MVDSVNSSGHIQSLQSIKSSSQKNQDNKQAEKSSAPVDDVQISEEALNIAQAENAAKEASSALTNDQSIALSSDQERLNALV
jgi:hypothetical protein